MSFKINNFYFNFYYFLLGCTTCCLICPVGNKYLRAGSCLASSNCPTTTIEKSEPEPKPIIEKSEPKPIEKPESKPEYKPTKEPAKPKLKPLDDEELKDDSTHIPNCRT